FVEGFSRLALPLTNLMRKGEKFVWNEEREKSFEELKQRLVSAPVLTLPSEEEIIHDLERLDIELYVRGQHGYWASMRIEPDLISRIKEAQKEDSEIWTIVENLNKQVKIEHQRASGLLQQLDIPVWKWDEISMDFVTGLPQTQRRHDAIWLLWIV
nr:hypothetical protein [Tanacetum cinerariifolium]